jgi:hypothetical protein
MRERPILFSASMVRALLDGTKTQTWRVGKPAQVAALSHVIAIQDPDPVERPPLGAPGSGWFGDEEGHLRFFSPYGKPGDRLWVRETWSTQACFDELLPSKLTTRSLHYWADGKILTGRQRPGIFMPRWASRITLEVTDVRVERLQDISETDACAEGAPPSHPIIDEVPREFGHPRLLTQLVCADVGPDQRHWCLGCQSMGLGCHLQKKSHRDHDTRRVQPARLARLARLAPA